MVEGGVSEDLLQVLDSQAVFNPRVVTVIVPVGPEELHEVIFGPSLTVVGGHTRIIECFNSGIPSW